MTSALRHPPGSVLVGAISDGSAEYLHPLSLRGSSFIPFLHLLPRPLEFPAFYFDLVCVCVCVCIYACTCVHMHMCVCAHAHIYVTLRGQCWF